jgi:two-component system, NtrC family, sensor kinase
VAKKSAIVPKILIVSGVSGGQEAFIDQVKAWPHPGFQFTTMSTDGGIKISMSSKPKIVIFGPDCKSDTVEKIQKKFGKAHFVWAKASWTAEELADVSRDLLGGYFLETKEASKAAQAWNDFLRTRISTGGSGKSSGERFESLMAFIKAVGGANDIFSLLGQLRREMHSLKITGDPILLLSRAGASSKLYYFRGKEPILRSVTDVPPLSARVRVHDQSDRQFLANQLGRPFGKVIAFPLLQERSSGWKISPVIFFEHQNEDADLHALIDRIGQRLQAVSLSLDRLVLEMELKRSSAVWEMTFDGIEEPIAIVDLDGEVVRSNRHFIAKELLGFETGMIKVDDSLFQAERYDIRIKNQGPVLSTVVHFHDVTRAMNLRERMIQLEKMSAIGHLAGHIAHELNNPLTGIRSLSQILIKDLPVSRLREDLSEVEQAAVRCQEIILNLLDFSKGTLDENTMVCDLNEIVRKTLPFLKSAMGLLSNEVTLSSDPIQVEVEPHLMQQVVFNLVNNACQALNGHGDVIVKTEIQNGQAILTVQDSGPGVPPELQKVIFEPFFTTKQEGQGTGLGLSFSREFVRRLGGDIVCESRVGGGALFRVALPVVAAQTAGQAS